MNKRYSFMSVFCDILADNLPNEYITVIFFCGLHALSKDIIQGLQGLLRSIISQLIDHISPSTNTELSYKSRLVKSIDKYNTEILCKLPVKTVKQIPAGRILMIFINDIGCFERKWPDGVRTLAETLCGPADGNYIAVDVKVVCTRQSEQFN
jgi:hypothetical protein